MIDPQDGSVSDTLMGEQAGENAGVGSRIAAMLRELVEILLISGILFLGVNAVTARVRVESISMQPTLHDGQFVVVNKLAYRWSEPDRGEIIVFHFPLNPEKRYIKRVIGLPGDRIEVRQDQVVYVNGIALDEPYLAAAPRYQGSWVVGLDQVFVLGDNRNNSNDSHSWGMLDQDAIVGKAVLIYWPIQEFGLAPHYEVMGAEG